MGKKLLSLLIILVLLLNSWNWPNHQSLVEKVYYSLDFKTQQELNITLLKEGAIIPDKIFHDNVRHSYPRSYPQAKIWLEKASDSYNKKDYENASLYFGIASHYITDTFAAPHNVQKEPPKLHLEFESIKYKPKTKCSQTKIQDLNLSLYSATQGKKEDWLEWVNTRNNEIPKRGMDQSLELLYPLAIQTFNSSCNSLKTEITKIPFKIYNKESLIFLTIIILILFISLIFRKNKIKIKL